MNTIALNIIIGQKPEPFLNYALESTKWCDEHVIVNTGKEDNPNMNVVREVLAGHDLKIIEFSRLDQPFTFAGCRSLALSESRSSHILWQDADEVHFHHFENIAREYVTYDSFDGIEFGFFHFIFDMFHFQSIDPRVILFKRHGKRWVGNVHEHVEPLVNVLSHPYRYHHYGYTKPQKEIYENWRLYWSLNPDENFKLNENRNPNDIISDRVSVAYDYTGDYPEVIYNYIKEQKPLVKDFHFI